MSNYAVRVVGFFTAWLFHVGSGLFVELYLVCLREPGTLGRLIDGFKVYIFLTIILQNFAQKHFLSS
jgi:hypothetical protein